MREGFLGKTLEDALQKIFEEYPAIIPGKQISSEDSDPPRFVLLRREMPIANWSLDHLFVDQYGVLTLVETKLFNNPESRREVIGQIIEYASNAELNWSDGKLREGAITYWSRKNPPVDVDSILSNEFGDDLNIDDFWDKIETNLKDGNFRLIIASDSIRPEIRRMIEYLNSEMKNTELLDLK